MIDCGTNMGLAVIQLNAGIGTVAGMSETPGFEPYITTPASNTRRDGRTEMLAEGQFRKGDSLYVEKGASRVPGQEEQTDTWTLTVPDDGQSSHTVRWLIPADKARSCTVYTMQADGWHKADSEQVGGYLCFTLEGNGQFAVVPAGHTAWWVWALVAAAGAAGILLVLHGGFRQRCP